MSDCSLRCRNGEQTFQRATAVEDHLDALEDQLAALEDRWGSWNEFQPVLRCSGNAGQYENWDINMGSGARRRGWWIQVGHRLHLRYIFEWGSPGYDGGLGRIYTVLPPGITASTAGDNRIHCQLWTTSGDIGPTDWCGSALIHSAEPWKIQPQLPFHGSTSRLGFYTIVGPNPGMTDWSVPWINQGFPEGGALVIQGTVQLD